MDKSGINIKNLGFGSLTREQVKAKFAGDPQLAKMLTIFDKIDNLDIKSIKEYEEMGFDVSEFGQKGVLSHKDFFNFTLFQEPGVVSSRLDNKPDKNITDWELEKHYEAMKSYLGEDIKIEDFREFLGFMASEGDKAYAEKLKNASQELGMSEELIDRLGGPSFASVYKPAIRDGKKVFERKFDDFTEVRDESGKLMERRYKHSDIIGYEDCEEITTYDEKGETSSSYINHQTGEKTKFIYGDTKEDTSYKIHIKDGVAVKLADDNDGSFKNARLEDIVFNEGSPDSTNVSFKYDENNKLVGVDIKDNQYENDTPRGFVTDGNTYLTHVPKETTVDKSTMEVLQSMMNNGARYGEDYDLKIVDGQLKVIPKVKNATGKEAPELKGEAFDKYKDLVSKGIHAGEDFDVEYDENGNFRYNLKNNQAREFGSDFKTELYDKNGNLISSLAVNGDEVVSENRLNGSKSVNKMSFNDAFLQLALEGNFEVAGKILGEKNVLAGGRNIYELADMYKEKTGRELIGDLFDSPESDGRRNLMVKLLTGDMGYGLPKTKEDALKAYQKGRARVEPVVAFNPQNSPISHLMPSVERIQSGENSFTEKINDDNFSVQFDNGKFLISKNNGENVSIDVSKFSENYVKNVLFKLNSAVLYDIAKTQTPLILNDRMSESGSMSEGANGYYRVDQGIVLDPNATQNVMALRVITHECGHMCDHVSDKDNAVKVLKERLKDPALNFYGDKPITLNELLEKQGILQPISEGDEKLRELFYKESSNYVKNRPDIDDFGEYAISSRAEFFAESYCLLNMGYSRSGYVIANYFPETFAHVKELIEQNRASREQ